MSYKPIKIDRENLTIMGVKFSDLDTLNSAANAIGSNMFEGFEPTPKSVEIIRDYISDKITLSQLIQLAKDRVYAQ
ncbi:MAG: antitoxin VbhA family protein [Elusimicrobiota bacterium]|jgi:putative transcriptional regulator|nr:antitoxin VbhA family protein [Elusimicrobiota bacterium]